MRNRYKKYKILEHKLFLGTFIVLIFILGIVLLVGKNTGSWLSPAGTVAHTQKLIILYSVGLMLLVLFPILGFAFHVAYKYRATNTEKVVYKPKWDFDYRLSTIRFIVPVAVVAILSVVVWKTSHVLDPFKPIAAETKPMTIQVVSLNWKWLFIYPDEDIATVNYVEVPANTPVNFELTSDGPMNSFWIPQLGGQMYSMAGMVTHIHLMASKMGEYQGSAAEINGKGLAGMRFKVQVVSSEDYTNWLAGVRQVPVALTVTSYGELAEPSENNPPKFYSAVENNLFETIVQRYMPTNGHMHM